MSTGLPEFECLLADIGGTHARFAALVDGRLSNLSVLDGTAYATLAEAARHYLAQTGIRPRAAAIAIAAPLSGDEVRMTNHTWRFSSAALRHELGLERLIVLNDFTALAMSLPHLPRAELRQIGGTEPQTAAPLALIGPGTGLGVSGLLPTSSGWLPLQGEGGHVTLPAIDEREAAVIAYLRGRFGHVSAERVVSGPGLVNVYEAVCQLEGVHPLALLPEQIADRAMQSTDPRCTAAVQLFCGWLGCIAGNLALTLGAVGGVYIGGGIVPRWGDYFARSSFRARFEDKGRYRTYLAPIPIYVIHAAAAAFFGLARAFSDPGPRIEVLA